MVGNCSSARVAAEVCGRASVSPTQPTAGPGDGERLLQDRAGNLPHAGDRADRRDIAQPRADCRLRLRRHEIAAVGAGADAHGLGVERLQTALVAAPHIALEGLFVLARLGLAAAERVPGGACLAGTVSSVLLLLVQRQVDAVDLVVGHDVLAEAALDLAEAVRRLPA
jgi:hypothetical protein